MQNVEYMSWSEHVSLKKWNTFGIDVTARYFAECRSENDLIGLLNHLPGSGKPLILGGGSNILFTRDPADPVIKNSITGIELISDDKEFVFVRVGAGVIWHDFVREALLKNWAGIENLSLIPGTVGAAPIQNIGAYGVEVKSVIQRVHAIDLSTLQERVWEAETCEFGYRDSLFKRLGRGSIAITQVEFRLYKNPEFHIDYGAIQQELERMGVKELTIQAISQAVIQIRTSKLPDPAKIGNAGSFFKNPEVPTEVFNSIRNSFPDVVGYRQANGKIKVAAGWLIEKCGWKGIRHGNAGVHPNQALVLVNYGDAAGAEILDLAERIKTSVADAFGVQLEMEVNIY